MLIVVSLVVSTSTWTLLPGKTRARNNLMYVTMDVKLGSQCMYQDLYTQWSNKKKLLTFVDISAMRADFCKEFYATFNDKMHTLPQSFVKIHLKMTKLCYFNEDNLQFLIVSSVLQNCSRVQEKRNPKSFRLIFYKLGRF